MLVHLRKLYHCTTIRNCSYQHRFCAPCNELWLQMNLFMNVHGNSHNCGHTPHNSEACIHAPCSHPDMHAEKSYTPWPDRYGHSASYANMKEETAEIHSCRCRLSEPVFPFCGKGRESGYPISETSSAGSGSIILLQM